MNKYERTQFIRKLYMKLLTKRRKQIKNKPKSKKGQIGYLRQPRTQTHFFARE